MFRFRLRREYRKLREVTRTLEAVCLKMRADDPGVGALKVENWKVRAVWQRGSKVLVDCLRWHKRLEPGRNRAVPGFLLDPESC